MLTKEQLRTLRRAKLTGPNKLRLAMTLVGVTQMQLSAAISLAQSQISEDAAGKFSDLTLTKARAYAQFFGCEIDDLFPAREAVAS